MPLHFTPLSQYFAAEVSAVDLRAVHDRDTLEQIRGLEDGAELGVVLDLDRFLRDEPIAVRKVSAAGGLLRWGLKRPW